MHWNEHSEEEYGESCLLALWNGNLERAKTVKARGVGKFKLYRARNAADKVVFVLKFWSSGSHRLYYNSLQSRTFE